MLDDGIARGHDGPIVLSKMGSFFFAGQVVRTESGDTVHCDHGYAQYFVPDEARNLPLVMWHGLGQSGKSFESTPDHREGFWQLFTRRGFPVYIIDQPRRGRAGRACPESPDAQWVDLPPAEAESAAWGTFRLGLWQPPGEPTFFPGLAFPTDAASLEQFFRQQTPNTGSEPFPSRQYREVLGGAVAELHRLVGPSLLMTHSHSGQYGWVTAMRAPDVVRGVIALEPGEFCFPTDEAVPEDVASENALMYEIMQPQFVEPAEFDLLTKIPILMVMGDNISATAHATEWGVELWRIVRIRAKQMCAALNARGGDATYLELPGAGLHGNTHFPMADLNNVEVADVIQGWMAERGLDATDSPHSGPAFGPQH